VCDAARMSHMLRGLRSDEGKPSMAGPEFARISQEIPGRMILTHALLLRTVYGSSQKIRP
jgi:hypothetical protein